MDAKTSRIVVRTLDALRGKPISNRQFPTCLPDGSEVSTVAQVAALMGVDQKVAAAYVLEQVEVNDGLVNEAKDFFPPPEGDSDGIAIMFYPDPSDAKQLSLDGGTPWQDLHITLGYFGKVQTDSTDPGVEDDLLYVTREVAKRIQPYDVSLNGVGRFSAKDEDAIVVLADSPVLEDARRALVDICGDEGIALDRKHGYTAHMTLGFATHDTDIPLRRWTERTIRINTIVLGYGKHYTHIDLNSGETKDVFNASIGPVSNLRTSAFVVERLSGRVMRINQKRKKKPKKVS